MTTIATINDLPLDEGLFRWPLYRGTDARRITLYGFGPRWLEYKAMVAGLQGAPARIDIRGSRRPGANEGVVRATLPEVYVVRATKINDVKVELWCYDSRLLLNREVGDMDFNMTFGDGFLDGTEFVTYREAIEAYCNRFTVITSRLAATAFDKIPQRNLEPNVHLSAYAAPDPLAYLCDRAGVDLTVGVDGKWYFASREDATAAWFAGFEDYNWDVRPGFLTLETLVLQRPRTIVSYYWEHHCIRAEAVGGTATASSYGPATTRIQLNQVYLYEGEYLSLTELMTAIGGGLSTSTITDTIIAKAFLSNSAQGTNLHPLDTFAKKVAWGIIRRDWRRLWRIEFPSGSTGGWDMWRFGKLNDDGSVDPVGVECPYVEFKRVVSAPTGQSIENQPYTFNRAAPAPFKAVWDDGPESAVIRIVAAEGEDKLDDLMPPMPGILTVPRAAASGLPTSALVIAAKPELDNTEGVKSTVRNLTLFGREDLSKGRFNPSFTMYVYLVARRFMPNNSTRWHSESAVGFADGDVDTIYLPPSGEINCYRTFVGGTAPTPAGDGLGAILNNLEIHDDAERRAEVWKLTHSQSAEGEGKADTLSLALKDRLVDGPVIGASIIVNGVETATEITVGNIADDKAREMTAAKRLAARGVDVQGVPIV